MIFGSYGQTVGHELVHAFGDIGYLFDMPRQNFSWMRKWSRKMYNETRQCIIDKYKRFCPLRESGLEPECLNAEATVSEDIADNAGEFSNNYSKITPKIAKFLEFKKNFNAERAVFTIT